MSSREDFSVPIDPSQGLLLEYIWTPKVFQGPRESLLSSHHSRNPESGTEAQEEVLYHCEMITLWLPGMILVVNDGFLLQAFSGGIS
jgi:hypothetical protein